MLKFLFSTSKIIFPYNFWNFVFVFKVQLGKCGRLVCVSINSDRHDISRWLQESMRSARDYHEQNIEAVRDATNGDVIFRTTRPIQCGEELFVWFENSLSREYSIPILTPANIKGRLYILYLYTIYCYINVHRYIFALHVSSSII